ncbi:MAG: hypothetical protein U1F98_07145 [Verrucomicrobiota bacterium]
MAFRIHDSVVRGQIDNRIRGVVSGKIWLEGRAEPVVLDLEGNAWPDLAGCLLTFTNPNKRTPHPSLDSLAYVQRGTIGDITASRKVRVFDVPLPEALAMLRRKETPPEHMANSLYIEWFSEFNGRVVIESADYLLEISAPEWRATREDDEQRAKQAAAGMQGFMRRLTEAIEAQQHLEKDPESWDEHDYERFLKENDARIDKYGELLDKYGDSEEAEEKIAREMGWISENEDNGKQEESWLSVEEINRACEEAVSEPESDPDPAMEGIDWIRTPGGRLRHPLQHRCFESAVRLQGQLDQMQLDRSEDKDLELFIFELQTTGAKLAGALSGLARGEPFPDPAFTVALLKRALGHLHRSQAGLEAVAPKNLVPVNFVAESRKELLELREGILNLMDEFRGRK